MKRAKILSASAGSGKTYQLALKYICDIIKHPDSYRNILAVTFTNKATEEMKSRILREIHQLASGGKSPYVESICSTLSLSEDKVRQRALTARTKILHNYSRFSVLTIDRFFQRILRAFIKELSLDLNYNIELDTNLLLERSADSLIESIAENSEIREGGKRTGQRRPCQISGKAGRYHRLRRQLCRWLAGFAHHAAFGWSSAGRT